MDVTELPKGQTHQEPDQMYTGTPAVTSQESASRKATVRATEGERVELPRILEEQLQPYRRTTLKVIDHHVTCTDNSPSRIQLHLT